MADKTDIEALDEIIDRTDTLISKLENISTQLSPPPDVDQIPTPHPTKFKLIRIRGIDDAI